MKNSSPRTIHTASIMYDCMFRHPGIPGTSNNRTKPAERIVPNNADRLSAFRGHTSNPCALLLLIVT